MNETQDYTGNRTRWALTSTEQFFGFKNNGRVKAKVYDTPLTLCPWLDL